MQQQLAALVEQPCNETFLAARAAVLRESSQRLTAEELADLESLLEQNEAEELEARLDVLPPSKVLSPRIHFLAAEAAQARGDFDEVELERSLFVLILQGILATGDGTPGNPYVVCHRSDEFDVLAALGREAAGQSLVEQNGRFRDIVLCSDGREVCFDVHDLFTACPADEPAKQRKLRAARQRGLRPVRLHG